MALYRMFDAAADATDVVEELKQWGFADHLQVVSGTADAAGMTKLGFDQASAEGIAERINAGAALVVVNPPFGKAIWATRILQGPQGSDHEMAAATPVASRSTKEFDNAAPLSSKLNWPVLLRNPTPLSSFLKIPTLSKRQNPRSKELGVPLLSRAAAPLSSKAGLKTLLSNPAPLSSLLGMKILINNPTPLSSKLNMQVLT